MYVTIFSYEISTKNCCADFLVLNHRKWSFNKDVNGHSNFLLLMFLEIGFDTTAHRTEEQKRKKAKKHDQLLTGFKTRGPFHKTLTPFLAFKMPKNGC